jgi:hypothetical protein
VATSCESKAYCVQRPARQTSPGPQATSQAPQFARSLSRSAHCPLHSFRPRRQRQRPFSQRAPAQHFVLTGQA